MKNEISTFVLPGDDITPLVSQLATEVEIGMGIMQQGDKVLASTAGMLKYREPNIFWVDRKCGRYRATDEDTVIGIIIRAYPEEYRVDYNGTTTALLSVVAFDGATKRSRPMLEEGSVVYCRVISTDRDLDTELSCKAPSNIARKDWSSGEAVFGELTKGFVFRVSLSLVERLLARESRILQGLAHFFAFEIAVGMNGLVWIDCEDNKDIVVISNAIQQGEKLKDEDFAQYLVNLVRRMKPNDR